MSRLEPLATFSVFFLRNLEGDYFRAGEHGMGLSRFSQQGKSSRLLEAFRIPLA